jgi:hypothetical protein
VENSPVLLAMVNDFLENLPLLSAILNEFLENAPLLLAILNEFLEKSCNLGLTEKEGLTENEGLVEKEFLSENEGLTEKEGLREEEPFMDLLLAKTGGMCNVNKIKEERKVVDKILISINFLSNFEFCFKSYLKLTQYH